MFFVQLFIFFMLTICFWLLIASFKKKAFAVLLLLTAAAVLSLFAQPAMSQTGRCGELSCLRRSLFLQSRQSCFRIGGKRNRNNRKRQSLGDIFRGSVFLMLCAGG